MIEIIYVGNQSETKSISDSRFPLIAVWLLRETVQRAA